MNGRYLLDTNIVIGLFRGETTVEAEIAKAVEVFVPSIVLGELHFGVSQSQQSAENLEKLNEFATENVVLPVDEITAAEYGIIKHSLKQKGRPIPENDLWIAAIAKQHDLVLATRDVHFQEIEQLATATW